jgi:hypothetical protein
MENIIQMESLSKRVSAFTPLHRPTSQANLRIAAPPHRPLKRHECRDPRRAAFTPLQGATFQVTIRIATRFHIGR